MIEYEEDWVVKLLFHSKGSVALRAICWTLPSTILCVFVTYMSDDEQADANNDLAPAGSNLGQAYAEAGLDVITDRKKSQIWLAVAGMLVLLLGFRTTQALSRFWEGTSLMHQMRGEWFDSASCLVTFTSLAVETKPAQVRAFRHTIVRLMSLCHGSALEEIADSDFKVNMLDMNGVAPDTLLHLKTCKEKYGFNRVELILHIVQTFITKALDDGVLKIPPPILTRVFQTLSRGYVSLLNAKKITDTRFPFPYAQLISGLLVVHMLLVPVMLGVLLKNQIWAPIFTTMAIFGLFSLNFVACQLENPFGRDDNDLPMARFQSEMNSSLLMLLHSRADHVAGVGPRCIREFKRLEKSMSRRRVSPSPATSRLSEFERYDWGSVESVPLSKRVTSVVEGGSDQVVGDIMVQELAATMSEFTRVLDTWTQVVEGQVGDLQDSLSSLKACCCN